MRISDWRSDVCSSDLGQRDGGFVGGFRPLDKDFAQGSGQDAGVFQKGDETDGLGTQALVFVLGEYAPAVALWILRKLAALFGNTAERREGKEIVGKGRCRWPLILIK